jgi:ubiquinone/menaquinone biosynthesis C-methylase UbiE
MIPASESNLSEDTAANVAANLAIWNQGHAWARDGDEWTGQAELCGVPYDDWKASLVEHLIAPNVTPNAEVIEIAPGHGRWSEHLISRARFVTLVDISPTCLTHCMRRFAAAPNVDYVLTTGSQLPRYAGRHVDFIWSYDSFVHMAPPVIAAYLAEFARVLRHGGKAIIHHANIADPAGHVQARHEGWRSAVNAQMVKDFAERAGLMVTDQFVYWDAARKIGVPRFGDIITALRSR